MTGRTRPAAPGDVAAIPGFVRDPAAFERKPEAVGATEASLADALFGAEPAAEAVIAERDGAGRLPTPSPDQAKVLGGGGGAGRHRPKPACRIKT